MHLELLKFHKFRLTALHTHTTLYTLLLWLIVWNLVDCLESRTDPKNRQTLNPLQGEEPYRSFPEEHH